MIRVNANRVVAPMTHKQPLRDRATVNPIREPVSAYITVLARERPIAPINAAPPLPATSTIALGKVHLEPSQDNWIIAERGYIIDVHSKPFPGFGCMAGLSGANAPLPLLSTPSKSEGQAR